MKRIYQELHNYIILKNKCGCLISNNLPRGSWLINQPYKNSIKSGENLENRPPFDRLKKMLTILLIVSFIVALTVEAASLLGMKTPGYQKGYKDGYRASYQAAFDDKYYDLKTGLGENSSYNTGYTHGYDEGYPDGQLDRRVTPENETTQNLETTQNSETNQNNETSENSSISQDSETSFKDSN